MRFLSATAAAALLMVLSLPAQAGAALETLAIETASGTHDFEVEVMREPAEMEKGLMFRRFMPQDRGMLFDFKRPQPVLMWMKNTYLSLDMLFIDANGKVIRVAEHAEPLSEAIIPSGGQTLGVLEVNAGTAGKIGVKPAIAYGLPSSRNRGGAMRHACSCF